jgi:hypothetical protein
MAAIMAVVDQLAEEESMSAAVPVPRREMSFWKYSGLQEMMSMRILWQLRMGESAAALAQQIRRRP